MAKIFASSLDLGTMFLQGVRETEDGKMIYTTVRDCYIDMPYDEEFEDVLRANKVHYLKDATKLYVLGEDAYRQAGMAEMSSKATDEILKRPMKDGILNPTSPKMALSILRELMKACLEQTVGPARKDEILYFSIPANPVDSAIDNVFHTTSAENYLKSLGYDARPIGEGLAVIFAENPKMHSAEGPVPFTGIGISMGAGQQNFCLADRGRPTQEFSVARSGDWIDDKVATMTGEPKTKVLRVKERKLDFNNLDQNDPIVMALDCYYENLVKYVFGKFQERFGSAKGFIEDPIDIVLSGGTASPPGLDKKVRKVLDQMNLPFKINEIRLAGGGNRDEMLKAVAKGCFIRAKQAAKKMTAAKEALETLEKGEKKK